MSEEKERMISEMENPWGTLHATNEDREKIWRKNRSFLSDIWYRFYHKPTAIAGLAITLLLIIFAAAGPYFTKYSYSEQNLDLVNIPPYMKVFVAEDDSCYFYITQSLKIVTVNKDGTLGTQLKKIR